MERRIIDRMVILILKMSFTLFIKLPSETLTAWPLSFEFKQ